jgi:hypothetical protein
MTPRGEWDSPVPTPRTTTSRITETESANKKVDISMSLDTFQDKYTSEDNASYPLYWRFHKLFSVVCCSADYIFGLFSL